MNIEAKFEKTLAQRSVSGLTRAACVVALIGLAVMAFSIVVPKPLPVIAAMSVGQGIGVLAFLLYLSAVLLDVLRTSKAAAQVAAEPQAPEGGGDGEEEEEEEEAESR
ncbi:MAG: hypothetical protein KF718_09960 [Polyangiaceae bacterium]|nr:hypothetical protein [Polyangiaceae bacterium]